MHRRKLVALLLMTCVLSGASGESMSRRITVGLEPHADQSVIADTLRSAGSDVVQWRVDPGKVVVIDLAADADASAIISKLRAVPGVRYAEPDSWQRSF
jgi:hypothetical protein